VVRVAVVQADQAGHVAAAKADLPSKLL
jgi:hypothetical protein